MPTWFVERPVGEMRPGDHAWLPFSTGEEQEHVIGAFVWDGLTTSSKVIYVGDARPDTVPGLRYRRRIDPVRYVEIGQLRVISCEQARLNRDHFDPDRMLTVLEQEIAVSLDQGYRTVRIVADMNCALRSRGGSELMRLYEDRLEVVVARSTSAMAICQIDRADCGPAELITLEDTHEVLAAANPEFDDGVLRITKTFAPAGLRLEGELDGARHAVFAEVLATATSMQETVHLDFARVRFIDLGALNLLATQAMRMPSGRSVVLDDLPPEVVGVIEMVGWHRLPGVSLGRRKQP
ncbi:MEDS domain-containing protein [Actinomadura sp. HBU206391]|uniref:MEDS domain-containing protein n=1 Tax=Actinomadura sp. HBU206391 TaxID=2731692 RepID=UPI00164F7D44|nr:MEDS domain-containing protein [Actinomadura sp. HBU206391]MBC6459755.1 MEDS domain-containing protein [Actinomadura sp. HBU206391]